jgi:hypothetical protein
MNLEDFVGEYREKRFTEDFPPVRVANWVMRDQDAVLEYPYFSIRVFSPTTSSINIELWLPYTRARYLQEITSIEQMVRVACSQFPRAIKEWFRELEVQEQEALDDGIDNGPEHLKEMQEQTITWFLEFNNSLGQDDEGFWRDWLLNSPDSADAEDWIIEEDFMGFGNRKIETHDHEKKQKK